MLLLGLKLTGHGEERQGGLAKEAAGFDKVFPIEAVMVASPWKKKRQREEEVQIVPQSTEGWKKPGTEAWRSPGTQAWSLGTEAWRLNSGVWKQSGVLAGCCMLAHCLHCAMLAQRKMRD